VPAGLTGLAQLSKGSAQLYTELDLEYLERVGALGSWALVRYDVEILARTIRVMARGEGLSF
jgi:lipopolysaccharide/colanic/teichoic acid biosynthesis glycosyltransferase